MQSDCRVDNDEQPAKVEFEKYVSELPKEEGDDPETTAHILCVMDDDNVYGQNYFLCLTEQVAQETIDKYTSAAAEAEAEAEQEVHMCMYFDTHTHTHMDTHTDIHMRRLIRSVPGWYMRYFMRCDMRQKV